MQQSVFSPISQPLKIRSTLEGDTRESTCGRWSLSSIYRESSGCARTSWNMQDYKARRTDKPRAICQSGNYWRNRCHGLHIVSSTSGSGREQTPTEPSRHRVWLMPRNFGHCCEGSAAPMRCDALVTPLCWVTDKEGAVEDFQLNYLPRASE